MERFPTRSSHLPPLAVSVVPLPLVLKGALFHLGNRMGGRPLLPAWQKRKAAGHSPETPAGPWNSRARGLAPLAPWHDGGEAENWERLLERLRVKRGHPGAKDPLSGSSDERLAGHPRELPGLCLSLRPPPLTRRPLKNDPLRVPTGKGLRDARQIDCVGPFRRSNGKYYALVGVEIASGLVRAGASPRAMGEGAVKALALWCGAFPKQGNVATRPVKPCLARGMAQPGSWPRSPPGMARRRIGNGSWSGYASV